MMIEKLKEHFGEMAIYKDLKTTRFFSDLELSSAFLRDWLIKKFSDDEGHIDRESLTEFTQNFLPKKSDWKKIKDRIINDDERVKILTKIIVDISIKTGEITFALPDFGLSTSETTIDDYTWNLYRNDLINGQEVWGIVQLGYRPPTSPNKKNGKIRLLGFTNFCPYRIDIDYYKDARAEFTVSEWIDVLLGAIDYNAAGYESEHQKLSMLTRLLPFVEKRVNLIELAPKGTAKSYVFGHVSKYGMLVDGGKVTRAKMFYDASKDMPGFIIGHDYVAIDEVKLVNFGDIGEMRSCMQGYLEYGEFNFGGKKLHSNAGVVFLGNIAQERMDEYQNMFEELPPLFQESALIDRIHGFIKGWEIPRMNDDLKICGWALNAEYVCDILHELRSDVSYRAIVDQIVAEPPKADTRDTEAVKRLATAYLKLLFPHVRNVDDVNLNDFNQYCLQPAQNMRRIIKKQLAILDSEFKGKEHLNYTVKDLNAFYL